MEMYDEASMCRRSMGKSAPMTKPLLMVLILGFTVSGFIISINSRAQDEYRRYHLIPIIVGSERLSQSNEADAFYRYQVKSPMLIALYLVPRLAPPFCCAATRPRGINPNSNAKPVRPPRNWASAYCSPYYPEKISLPYCPSAWDIPSFHVLSCHTRSLCRPLPRSTNETRCCLGAISETTTMNSSNLFRSK